MKNAKDFLLPLPKSGANDEQSPDCLAQRFPGKARKKCASLSIYHTTIKTNYKKIVN